MLCFRPSTIIAAHDVVCTFVLRKHHTTSYSWFKINYTHHTYSQHSYNNTNIPQYSTTLGQESIEKEQLPIFSF